MNGMVASQAKSTATNEPSLSEKVTAAQSPPFVKLVTMVSFSTEPSSHSNSSPLFCNPIQKLMLDTKIAISFSFIFIFFSVSLHFGLKKIKQENKLLQNFPSNFPLKSLSITSVVNNWLLNLYLHFVLHERSRNPI